MVATVCILNPWELGQETILENEGQTNLGLRMNPTSEREYLNIIVKMPHLFP